MSEERLAKTVYVQEMTGKRPRGRLRKRWADDWSYFTFIYNITNCIFICLKVSLL